MLDVDKIWPESLDKLRETCLYLPIEKGVKEFPRDGRSPASRATAHPPGLDAFKALIVHRKRTVAAPIMPVEYRNVMMCLQHTGQIRRVYLHPTKGMGRIFVADKQYPHRKRKSPT
jgi:hypothetical protein